MSTIDVRLTAQRVMDEQGSCVWLTSQVQTVCCQYHSTALIPYLHRLLDCAECGSRPCAQKIAMQKLPCSEQ